MNSRTVLNLSIFIIVIILGVVVFYQPQQAEKTENSSVLTMLTPDAVESITINAAQEEKIHLIKKNQQWYIQRPIVISANPQRIESILQLAVQPSHSQYKVDESNFAKYGLDRPQATILFNHTELRFGENDPIHQRRYVLANGKIHLISDRISYLIKDPAENYINPAIIPNSETITTIKLPAMELSLMNGTWRKIPSENTAIKQDEAQKFVDGWRYAQALSVAIDNNTPQLNSKNSVSVSTPSQTYHFAVTTDKDGTYLQRTDQPVKYLLSTDTAQSLLPLDTN